MGCSPISPRITGVLLWLVLVFGISWVAEEVLVAEILDVFLSVISVFATSCGRLARCIANPESETRS